MVALHIQKLLIPRIRADLFSIQPRIIAVFPSLGKNRSGFALGDSNAFIMLAGASDTNPKRKRGPEPVHSLALRVCMRYRFSHPKIVKFPTGKLDPIIFPGLN